MHFTRQLSTAILLVACACGTAACGDDGSSGAGGQGGENGQGGEGGQGEGGQGQGGEGGQGQGGQGQGGEGGQGQGGQGQGGQGQGGEAGQGGGSSGCTTAEQCPAPGECQSAVCTNGACSTQPIADGTPTATQTAGDCQIIVCDGSGGTREDPNNLDSLDDELDCTVDGCAEGAPTTAPAAVGVSCDDGGGQRCDGAGACVECVSGADCTSGVCTANACADATCSDAVHNGDESDVDCGGICPGCTIGHTCGSTADCAVGECIGGVCATVCGDGVLQEGEVCDDGNAADCDGCSANCSVVETGCGDGVQCGDEACDDGNTDDSDACLSTCVAAACGDGFVQAGVEACDDANTADDDCCSSLCQLSPTCESEPNNACTDPSVPFTPSPSVVIQGAITPIGDQDLIAFTLPASASVRVQTFSGNAPGACAGAIDTVIELRGPDCTTVLTSNDDAGIPNCSLIDPTVAANAGARRLPAGTYYVRVEDYQNNGVIPAYNVQITLVSQCGNGVTEPLEECDDSNTIDGDGCDSNCSTTRCGNGIIAAGEQCDDGNTSDTDACLGTCVLAVCGDGFVQTGVETCDDGNPTSGDGCSTACASEPGFQCTSATPNVCTAAEDNCSDGIDNDSDGVIDVADTDCAFGTTITACAAGETLLVYNAVDVPRAIADNSTFTSRVVASNPGTIQRAIVGLSITHTYDGDLDLGLRPPVGATIDLSSDNGSTGDNYTNTVFDSTCATAITAGTSRAPYTGCFRPEQTLAGLTGQPATGIWQLSVGDDATGDIGSLVRWSLALCVTP